MPKTKKHKQSRISAASARRKMREKRLSSSTNTITNRSSASENQPVPMEIGEEPTTPADINTSADTKQSMFQDLCEDWLEVLDKDNKRSLAIP